MYIHEKTKNKGAQNSNQRKQRKQSREKVWNKVSFPKLNRDQAFKLKGLTYNSWIHDKISIFRPITMQFQKTKIKEFQKLPERKTKAITQRKYLNGIRQTLTVLDAKTQWRNIVISKF